MRSAEREQRDKDTSLWYTVYGQEPLFAENGLLPGPGLLYVDPDFDGKKEYRCLK